jgi:aspartate/methionine/tyrosine aminotransferase
MSCFSDADVPLGLLRERAFNLRWATLPPDVIPLTAADPDFPAAPCIGEAIAEYARGGVFSYGPAAGLPAYRAAVAADRSARRGLAVDPAAVVAVDSAAAGMAHVARLALEPGDEAIIFDPVDFLFAASVEAAGGRVRRLPVCPRTGALDLDALPSLWTPRTRLLGVCNPLNPVGRVLRADELHRLGAFAVERGLTILNDEVWSDIVYAPHRFVSLPALDPAYAARTFTVHSFSKSWGLAGLRVGWVAAPDAAAAAKLLAVSRAETTMTGVATLSQIGAVAALQGGAAWFAGFLGHLQEMRDLAVGTLGALPGVRVRAPEGTYVLFADVSARTGDVEALCSALREEQRVAVVPGATRWFGPGAAGHLRVCFATAPGILTEGLRRVAAGLEAAG